MGAQRSSFDKLQRDRAKKARAAAKREQRQDRVVDQGPTTTAIDLTGEGELSAGELLKLIEAIHQRFEDGGMDFEEFEEKKGELLARLPVD